jgi:hypothetical protein
MYSIHRIGLIATLAVIAAVPAHTQHHDHAARARLSPPESMRIEHEAIHARLVRATEAPGAVGEAARRLARVLHPHFVREEEIALPPLALLEPLARGEFDPSMEAVLPMTDALRAELPRMLEEHVAIGAAARELEHTARAAGNVEVERLAQALLLHARTEQEVLYPAAIMVGDWVRSRVRQADRGEP